ncbi:MAG: hypothetical protein HGB17_08350 [Syntrophobacteraceae bacterium]|nr:hypothetical protein [Syntrophobacteraceae bacterium]
MDALESPRTRQINGVTILGPNLFDQDPEGRLLTPIASIFPTHRLLVTLRGIHATQIAFAVGFLAETRSALNPEIINDNEETVFYEDAVSLLIREGVVLIRSEPEFMAKIFAADEVLQLLLPKQRIQFTGIHLAEVRRELRARGESWRISPAPHSVEEMVNHIRLSRVSVATGTTFYHSAVTGERFLTYQQFMSIRPLLREDRREALARLEEIVQLSALFNRESFPELSFFVRPERHLRAAGLTNLISILKDPDADDAIGETETLFDRFALSFATAAGAELMVDFEAHAPWRTAMFSKLFHIDMGAVEEWTLGVSPEFYLNVRWLPGANIVSGESVFEPEAPPRIRALINHYRNICSGLVSINLGSVEWAQTSRDRTGEEREVYLATLGFDDGRKEIRILRGIKWDVIHRLKIGLRLEQAIWETLQYRSYIFDRLKAFVELGIPIPPYAEIVLHDDFPSVGTIPVFFIERPYLPGIVSEKIPGTRYVQPEFLVRLAGLLGLSAAVSLIMGRACPRTGHIYFDDGDEVIQFDDQGLPERLVLSETTGSFTDWTTPLTTNLTHCLVHLAVHLDLAGLNGLEHREMASAVEAFTDGLVMEIGRMQRLLQDNPLHLKSLFADRSGEPDGIRHRWGRILGRLESADMLKMRRVVTQSPHLTSYQR